MKNILLFISISVVLAGSAIAQATISSGSSPASKAARFTQTMTTELDLTGEQREAVHCAYLTFLQEKTAIMNVYAEKGGNSMDARMKLLELRRAKDRKIQDALTVSQVEKYTAYQKAEKAQMGIN